MKKFLKIIILAAVIFAMTATCVYAAETTGENELLPPSTTVPLPQEGGYAGGASPSPTETSGETAQTVAATTAATTAAATAATTAAATGGASPSPTETSGETATAATTAATTAQTVATTAATTAAATTEATTAATTGENELLPPSTTVPLPQEGGYAGGASDEGEKILGIAAVRFDQIVIGAIILIVYLTVTGFIFGRFKKGEDKQDNVVNATNNLIDGYEAMEKAYKELAGKYDAMRKAYEKYGQTEADRNRVIGAVMEQSAAILEILQFAYANSSKLPQGIKDVINLKYANTLKTLGNDEKLLELVKIVREGINAAEGHGEESDE